MYRFVAALISLATCSYSAAIESSAEEDCSRPFVDDTLFRKDEAFVQSLYFCKGYGETLGVAAVKLQLREKDKAENASYSVGFYWSWGNPYYNGASGGAALGGGHSNVDAYVLTRGIISSSKHMAYSDKDADKLKAQVLLDFAPYETIDPARMLAIGDTLHWTLSFIYFHSSKMSIWYWNNDGTADAWKGSDTMTVRYRTIMQLPYPSEGLAGRRQGSPDGPALGRYDLQGRPLHDQSTPRGLIFERTKQGFRKRLQLR